MPQYWTWVPVIGALLLILAWLAHGGASGPRLDGTTPQWYNTAFRVGFGERRFSLGTRLLWDRIASAVYFVIVVASLLWYANQPVSSRGTVSDTAKVLFGLLVSVAPPLWFFLETRSLEAWLQLHTATTDVGDFERSYFARMTEHARNIWAALIAVYAAMLISFGKD